jgi:hypothetical protein
MAPQDVELQQVHKLAAAVVASGLASHTSTTEAADTSTAMPECSTAVHDMDAAAAALESAAADHGAAAPATGAVEPCMGSAGPGEALAAVRKLLEGYSQALATSRTSASGHGEVADAPSAAAAGEPRRSGGSSGGSSGTGGTSRGGRRAAELQALLDQALQERDALLDHIVDQRTLVQRSLVAWGKCCVTSCAALSCAVFCALRAPQVA